MNEAIMNAVINQAVENVRNGGGPFAAAIIKDGKIISSCGNSVTKTNDPTAHAEVNAIREACRILKTFELKGCELYTSCEPCPMCLGAIYWSRLDRVYFAADRLDAAEAGFDDRLIYDEIEKAFNVRKIKMELVNIDTYLEPFKEWKKFSNKINY